MGIGDEEADTNDAGDDNVCDKNEVDNDNNDNALISIVINYRVDIMMRNTNVTTNNCVSKL